MAAARAMRWGSGLVDHPHEITRHRVQRLALIVCQIERSWCGPAGYRPASLIGSLNEVADIRGPRLTLLLFLLTLQVPSELPPLFFGPVSQSTPLSDTPTRASYPVRWSILCP